MKQLRLLLVDDSPLICDSMTRLIEKASPGFKICGAVMNRTDALSQVRKLVPDVCLVDISINGREGGLDLMREIRNEFPLMGVLAVSLHDEDLYAERALRAGADGYLSKAEVGARIVEAVDQILNGRFFVSGRNGEAIIERYQSNLRTGGTEIPV